MRKNKLKQIWREGGAAINGWLHIPSSWSAEVLAHAGYDSLTIDLEHGFHTIETALTMMQAISTTDTVPLVRCPWKEPMLIQRLLDAGAYGVICPMIETREECEMFVGACRYPPLGYRSKGPTRAKIYGGADYASNANNEIVTFAMIETAQGLANVEEICSVEGLDGIFVGPGDLSLALTGNWAGVDPTEQVVVEAMDTILATVKAHGLVAATYCGTVEYAKMMIGKGWQMVNVSSDTSLLANAAKQANAALRGVSAELTTGY